MKHNRLYIDSEAIKSNYNKIKEKVGRNTEIVPVVKANAYGMGLSEIVSLLPEANIFAVANVEEAKSLRELKPNAKIIIIYQPFMKDIQEIVLKGFTPIVSNLDFVKELNNYAKEINNKVKIHLEIDTGMCRFGIQEKDCECFANEIKKLEHIIVEGLCMHYTSVDSLETEDLLVTQKQTDLFNSAVIKIQNTLGEVKYLHAASGAGIFNPHAQVFNMVRPGYILYGYYASESLKKLVTLKPALKLATNILHINEYDENTPVGYSHTFITKQKTKIATIAMGYSSGLDRGLSNKGYVVINNERFPIIGNICMDTAMIDITDSTKEIKVDDEVFIFDNELVTLEEVVGYLDTIGYEFLVRIHPNVTKIIK